MSDIVERLRAMPSSFNDALRTMEEAADEIERLLEEAAQIVERYCDSPMITQVTGEAAAKAIRALKDKTNGTVRNERYARGADADSQRAPGDH